MAKILKDAKEIGKLIVTIGTTGKKLDAYIQQASLSIIDHIDSHGNPSLANRLVKSMPKGSRVNAVISHMTKYGKMKYDPKTEKIVYSKHKSTDLQGAKDNPWWELKPEAPFKPETFDIVKILQNKLNKNKEDLQRDNLTIEQKTLINRNIESVLANAKALNINLDK